MFNLPSDADLYDALLARDVRFDGHAFVGVTSTGVFCRLSCPARKPKRENCQFFDRVAAAIEAGFRPCKRCHPLAPAAGADPSIQTLLAALETRPTFRWREGDVAALGVDPSTARRSFKRHFGMTFLEMARQRRLAHGFSALEDGKVIDAQLEASFESPAAFRTAFAKLLGATPDQFRAPAMLRASPIETPIGTMIAVCDDNALHLLEFADRKALPAELKRLGKMTKDRIGVGKTPVTAQLTTELNHYFAGENDNFQTPLVLHGTPFTRQVWTALRAIPAGQTRSYSALAQSIDAQTATRAVARANGANQIAILIPCHRVIGADGALTGYGGGLWRKQRLIELEHHYAKRTSHDTPR